MSYFATLPPPAEVLQPQVQAQQTQVAQQPQISDRRYGVKLKIAAFVAIAYIVLSSHTFLKVMNAIVCGIWATSEPCIDEFGSGTPKGLVIGGIILFVLTMFWLGGL
jgi:hypothetical protein